MITVRTLKSWLFLLLKRHSLAINHSICFSFFSFSTIWCYHLEKKKKLPLSTYFFKKNIYNLLSTHSLVCCMWWGSIGSKMLESSAATRPNIISFLLWDHFSQPSSLIIKSSKCGRKLWEGYLTSKCFFVNQILNPHAGFSQIVFVMRFLKILYFWKNLKFYWKTIIFIILNVYSVQSELRPSSLYCCELVNSCWICLKNQQFIYELSQKLLLIVILPLQRIQADSRCEH